MFSATSLTMYAACFFAVAQGQVLLLDLTIVCSTRATRTLLAAVCMTSTRTSDTIGRPLLIVLRAAAFSHQPHRRHPDGIRGGSLLRPLSLHTCRHTPLIWSCPQVEEPQQIAAVAQLSDFIFDFDTETAAVNNAGGGLMLQAALVTATLQACMLSLESCAGGIVPMDVAHNPLLAAIPVPGISLNRGWLNPCSVLLPHLHPRATEVHMRLAAAQNLTFAC